MIQAAHDYEECPDAAMDDKKAKIGRKLSRVLSIFRKKSTEEAIKSGLEPVYEELIYSNGSTDIRLSSPQYSFSTLDRLDSGYSASSIDRLEPTFAEILRHGRPYPQVVGGSGWWVRGFRHRAPTLFLPTEELTPIEPAYIDTSIKIDKKAHFYRTEFLQKEHMNLVGYSRVWGPLVLSVRQEQKGYKLILRSVSGTETREVTEPEETEDWANLVFGSLSLDQFSQVVCLDSWARILAYDEHSINKVHQIGLFCQKEKQFCASSLLSNTGISKNLSQFLAAVAEPIRGTSGQTAYYVKYRDNDIVIHPGPIMKTHKERRERVLTSLVQIVFQEDQVPFSPDLMGEDKDQDIYYLMALIQRY